MVYKSFRWAIAVRLVLIVFNIIAISIYIAHTNYYTSIFVLSATAVLQIAFLIRYIEYNNNQITRFLSAIKYDDFSASFSSKEHSSSFIRLQEEFNYVIKKFRSIRAEKEANFHYLKSIVQHVQIGLIVVNKDQEVLLINNAFKNILHINALYHLSEMQHISQQLYEEMIHLGHAEKKVIPVQVDDQTLSIAIQVIYLKILEEPMLLFTFQDIQTELDEKEMEAWQNLTRVLTHEIINSVTPIASLSATANSIFRQHQDSKAIPEEDMEDISQSIQIIEKRSEGLIRFVKDFRNLTKIPEPQFRDFEVKRLIEDTIILMKEEFRINQVEVSTSIEPDNLVLNADFQLIEQIMINLVKNAIQALEKNSEKHIWIQAYSNNQGNTIITVKDNGSGISDEALKNIFIPFFTTKKKGSGIGLSLSRLIMRKHGGSISIQKNEDRGVSFILKFN